MKPVHIKQNKNIPKQSKTHARYEKLLTEIEKLQQFNANISDGLHKAQVKINGEMLPLIKERHLFLRDYIIRLDELSIEIGLGKYNREWFESYMSDELDSLLDFFGHQDKVLSDLYEKYAGLSADDIAENDDLKATVNSLSDAFGFKIDLKEFLEKGEKEYFEEYGDKIHGNLNNGDEFSTEKETSHTNDTAGKAANIKKTQGDVQLDKDARSIYMRLVKKFHPDLEMDALIRDKNNEIIKQVTKAYQENDFFSLLKLQITYLEDNETDAAKVADDMLKRYNKILQKQLDDLQRRIHEMHFAGGDIIEDFIDKNGKFSTQKFAARKRAIEKENTILKSTLTDSKKRPKGWFKDQIGVIKDKAQRDIMEDIIGNMFNNFY